VIVATMDMEGLMKKFVVWALIAFGVLGSVAVAIDMTSPAYAGKQSKQKGK
jgi:hypothetical protein